MSRSLFEIGSMISLFGLCLATGRTDEGRSILSTFGRYLSEGMLPNYFPDGGQAPEYNTSDATLWWAWALYGYYKATGDIDFVKAQLPLLQEVVEWHKKGTRHGLRLDSDGLVTGGDASVQLTWMDAKVGNYVVTPRSGKAVEINALWYNALRLLENWLREEGDADADRIRGDADRVYASFNAKFVRATKDGLRDVVDGESPNDEACRPNQIFAVSLPHPVLDPSRWAEVVAVDFYAKGKFTSACTGTLISPNVVLTAAHCLVSSDATRLVPPAAMAAPAAFVPPP